MDQHHHPPLKRHPGLVRFSREHQVALVQAQHLLKAARADSGDRRRVLAEFLQVWDKRLSRHFADEERLLSGLIRPDQLRRLTQEHRVVRDMVEEIRRFLPDDDPGAAWTRQAAQTLDDHIRWEERVLFESIQSLASPEQLMELMALTQGSVK